MKAPWAPAPHSLPPQGQVRGEEGQGAQRPGLGLREGSLPGVPLLRFVPPSSFPLKASQAHADHSPGF